MKDVLVIGGGVMGLTCGVRLAEEGWRVRVWSAARPEDTTSAVAAAIWYPYLASPEARVAAWGERTYRVLEELSADAETGVRMLPGIELSRGPIPDPPWAAAVPDLRHARPDELPPGYADALVLSVPMADMAVYLPWLEHRLLSRGATLEVRRAASLAEAAAEAPLVVDCTGLGARELAGDESLYPVRGQIVRVENPGLTRFWLDDENPAGLTYIIPRFTDCVLGGTSEKGRWETEPDPEVAAAIVERCAALEPALANARVLSHRVGLRPGRPEVRLEAETLAGGARCIHCYGHGGAGVTLAWGCADEVAALASAG